MSCAKIVKKCCNLIIIDDFFGKTSHIIDLHCVTLPTSLPNVSISTNANIMRKIIISALLFLCAFSGFTSACNEYYSCDFHPQTDNCVSAKADSIFVGNLYNKEYDVIVRMNFIDNDILVAGQELFGKVSGYIKSSKDSRCWIVTSVEIDRKNNSATLEIINDYGSEDLIATLTYNSETNTYTLRQKSGSTIKFAKKGKWQKLPSSIEFEKK